VIEDTSLALKLQPDYIKAIARRAQAYEELKQLQEAVTDLKRLLELDASYQKAAGPRLERLEKELEAKRQKEQEEMMGQLKDMGNKFLGLFGLSLDNFKAEKDASGSYKINFSQK
jgi:predicted TPR repeat methyltransferase